MATTNPPNTIDNNNSIIGLFISKVYKAYKKQIIDDAVEDLQNTLIWNSGEVYR